METITTSEDALLAGLIGRGIMLSRTPLMHMREAQAQGLFTVYEKLDMDAPAAQLLDFGGQLGETGTSLPLKRGRNRIVAGQDSGANHCRRDRWMDSNPDRKGPLLPRALPRGAH